jgi:hypothetical protein
MTPFRFFDAAHGIPFGVRATAVCAALAATAGALLPASAVQAAPVTYDFQAWIADNGERGFSNSSPFQLTVGGLTLTATAFELPGNTASHVYMDDRFNGFIGGMGVCSVLNARNQCTPSSDDNVSIDAGKQEKLVWEFSENIRSVTLTLRDSQHFLFNGADTPGGPNDSDTGLFQYSYGTSENWVTASTDALGMYSLVLDGSSNALMFRAVATGLSNQFYIASAQVAAVPLPPALMLLLSGLAAVGVMGRRKT